MARVSTGSRKGDDRPRLPRRPAAAPRAVDFCLTMIAWTAFCARPPATFSGARNAAGRQVEVHGQAGADGRAHRGRLREAGREREGGGAPRVGDGEQADGRREQARRLRSRQARHQPRQHDARRAQPGREKGSGDAEAEFEVVDGGEVVEVVEVVEVARQGVTSITSTSSTTSALRTSSSSPSLPITTLLSWQDGARASLRPWPS